MSVSFIFGPETDGVWGMISSSSADMGGLIASGEGTAAGCPNEVADGPRLKPRLGKFAGGCGVAPGTAADGVAGAAPLLNSAQRGHFRLVSAINVRRPYYVSNTFNSLKKTIAVLIWPI